MNDGKEEEVNDREWEMRVGESGVSIMAKQVLADGMGLCMLQDLGSSISGIYYPIS